MMQDLKEKSLLQLFCCLFLHLKLFVCLIIMIINIVVGGPLLLKKKLSGVSTLPNKNCTRTCENLGDLAIEFGLNWSKFSSKSFSILAIFPEVPVPTMA